METKFSLKLLVLPFLASMTLLGVFIWLPAATAAIPAVDRLQAHRPSAIRPVAVDAPQRGAAAAGDFIQMEIRDVVPLPEAKTHAVVLVSGNGETILPVFVDEETALAVAFRLAQRPTPHPLAADLLGGVIARLGAKLVSVRLNSLVANEYIGSVRVSRNGDEFDIDARPSDALAVAVESGAPVFASPDLIKDIGITKGQIEELRKALPGLEKKAKKKELPPGIEL